MAEQTSRMITAITRPDSHAFLLVGIYEKHGAREDHVIGHGSRCQIMEEAACICDLLNGSEVFSSMHCGELREHITFY